MINLVENWIVPEGLQIVCSGRQGGVSHSPFNSLNLATHVGDDSSQVLDNREIVRAGFHMPGSPHWLDQIHSNRVVEIDQVSDPAEIISADGSYTQCEGQVLAIMVADCLPIAICSQSGAEFALVHAGWRGLATGIIDVAVAKFAGQSLLAFIGPGIGQCHYEVDQSTLTHFDRALIDPFIRPGRDATHWMMDLQGIAREQLRYAGVENIQVLKKCSFCETEDLFSYRRDGLTGRFAMFAWRGN